MTTTEHSSVQRIRQEEHSTLPDLRARLLQQQATKIDYVVDTRRMSFASQEGESYLTFDSDDPRDEGTGGGCVNQHTHGQIRDRLSIPAKYYNRMRQDAPSLLDQNVQHWLHNSPEKRLVRMADGKVRAFLSNRYRMLDNLDLMEKAVLPELNQYQGRLVFHVAALTDERLYVRALLPDLAADITLDPKNHTMQDGGDIVQAGVEIRNSEVGSGALSVAPFIWRLRCFNGLVIKQAGLARYHLGRELEESAYAIYRDDTLEADDKAFWLKVRDAVGAALAETTFTAIVSDLAATLNGVRIADPVAATEKLAQRYDLDGAEEKAVLWQLTTEGDLSQWGMVNAVTAAAKNAEGFQRQAEMEELGGALVALPEREWVAIAR